MSEERRRALTWRATGAPVTQPADSFVDFTLLSRAAKKRSENQAQAAMRRLASLQRELVGLEMQTEREIQALNQDAGLDDAARSAALAEIEARVTPLVAARRTKVAAILDEGVAMVLARVADWNWVDEEGKPLPTPGEAGFDADALYPEEVEWLREHLAEGPVKKS